MPTYTHLGPYSDLFAANSPLIRPGESTRQKILDVMNFNPHNEQPLDLRTGRTWQRDGVLGEELSWSPGYGPRTVGWFLRPASAGISGAKTGPLPGILALHDHGAFKFYGKEKIAEGPDPLDDLQAAILPAYRQAYYGGRAYPNELARRGYAVLVADTFLWGSRKFPFEVFPEGTRRIAATYPQWGDEEILPGEIMAGDVRDKVAEVGLYNAAAMLSEDLVEKYCTLLGTTFAAVVSYEDRVMANVLAARPEVDADRIACIGLSGGGCRAAMLGATSRHIRAAVIVGMMSTYAGLLDRNVASHTWMFFPHGWPQHGDWTDLAAARAPMPLLCLYNDQDPLFSSEGMHAADQRLADHYAFVGAPANYRGEFYPGPHKFDLQMQESAFRWLAEIL